MAISDKLILIAFVALAIGTVNGQAETGVRATELTCLQCEGEQCLRTSLRNNTVTCDGNCVAVFEQFRLQQRGCLSSLSATDQTACNLATNKTCYTCDTDLCNNLGRVDHTCLVCSSANDTKCLNEPLNVNHTRCPASLALDAFCYTKLHMNATSRGCLTTNREIIECVNDKQQCSWCSVNETGACNTVEFPTGRRQCLHCNSSVDKNCPTNATSADAKSIYCDNIHDTCIVINRGEQHGVMQTCVDKISADDNEFCMQNNGSCILCNENNCNWKKPAEPSSCSRLNVMHATTVLAIAIVGFMCSS